MAKKQVGPGVKCRIVGSSVGPTGSAVGKIVNVVGRSDPPDHVVWGDMWDVEAIDGVPFRVKVTSPDMQTVSFRASNYASCAEDWLEPMEDDPEPQKAQEHEQELTH